MPNNSGNSSQGPKLTCLGWVVILLILVASGAGALFSFFKSSRNGSKESSESAPPQAVPQTAANSKSGGQVGALEIGIAYGTEKERWLKPAIEQFAKTPEGQGVRVNLIPKGSLEAARAIVAGDQSIQVWSPASSIYKDVFLAEWQVKNSGANPIAKETQLALTPMVFVMWGERHEAFVSKYQTVSFKTIGQALAEKGGWDSIAKHPEWGLFKFGHTHPNQSNSGLATLVLMAYNFHNKTRQLVLADIVNVEFQQWMGSIEQAVTGLPSGTGAMMTDMVLKGPSAYDVVSVYENVAIDFLKNAEGRWGPIRIAYPEQNVWNDNPYYILDVPGSSKEQRRAAEALMNFLMSEKLQKQALDHGFRPGNPDVPIRTPESIFTKYQTFGIRIEIPSFCETPKAEVINNLLASWQRSQGGR